MSRCAALERDWIKTKEVIPWTAVASTTRPTSGSSRWVLWFAITPSIRNFVEPGRARPATRTWPFFCFARRLMLLGAFGYGVGVFAQEVQGCGFFCG